MRIIKEFFGTIINDINVSEKARDDSFVPVTEISDRYLQWRAQIDLKTCPICRTNHGRIYEINEIIDQEPPIHPNCRCQIIELEAIKAGNATDKGIDGADYWLKHYGRLPEYYISSDQLSALGWRYGDRPSKFAPGRMLGGDIFDNKERRLPNRIGRIWYEADINYSQGRRNLHRIFWSNDGLVFVTYNHGLTFFEII